MVIWLLSYIVEFVVESAGIADRLSVGVPPPQGRLRRLAVGTRGALPPGCALLEKVGTKASFTFWTTFRGL